MIINKHDAQGSWTRGVELGNSLFEVGVGVALLWYRPRRRLSLSMWVTRRWVCDLHFRGPRLIPWQQP